MRIIVYFIRMDTYSAEMARKHNDANCISQNKEPIIVCLGARRTSFE